MRPTSKQAPSGLCPAFMLTGGYITEPSPCKSLITRLVNGNRRASPRSPAGFRNGIRGGPGSTSLGKRQVYHGPGLSLRGCRSRTPLRLRRCSFSGIAAGRGSRRRGATWLPAFNRSDCQGAGGGTGGAAAAAFRCGRMRNALRCAACHMCLGDGVHLLADLGGGLVQGIAQGRAGLGCRRRRVSVH